MAVKLSEADLVRLACDTAESFADAFYTTLDNARSTIKEYYVQESTLPSGIKLPFISYNGNVSTNSNDFQDAFQDMPFTHHEITCLNANVVNPCIDPENAKTQKDAERNISINIQVSGVVRLHERKDGPLHDFSDNFVIVPNKEEVGGKGTGKQNEGRQWVIQTQNFRHVT